MKKVAFTVLTVVLMLTLVCGSALALTGDVTMEKAPAYADPDFTMPVGTIPQYTALLVRAYGSYANVIYNGVKCYIEPSKLTQGKYDGRYIGTATLLKDTKVYQRPTTSSKSKKLSKACKVKVYKIAKGFALVRNSKGYYAFVDSDDLSNLSI